jgi:hypothetical protein
VIADRVDIELLVDALGRDDALVRRDVNRIKEDILELDVAVAAEDSDRVLNVAWINGIAALQEIVELAEYLARERLLCVRSRDSKRGAADADSYAERLLYGADMCVMLSEEVGKEPRVVEVKFERIVGD